MKRFTAEDPKGMEGGTNVYGYALDSPVFLQDALGLAVDINLFNPQTEKNGWQAADDYEGDPAECTVSGHGDPLQVAGYSPRELADLIEHTPACNGKPVRLLVCNTGVVPYPDRPLSGDPFGKVLSRNLDRAVLAPDNWGWYMNDGTYGVYPTTHDLPWTAGPADATADHADLTRPGGFNLYGGP
jgi:hypothetical protein